MNSAFRSTAIMGLLALGLLQMAADLAGLPILKGLAAATHASPAPKVFSSVQGLETFSTRFRIIVDPGTDRSAAHDITPERYARVRGPYNRRNVYGAALSYAPVLAADPQTSPMLDAVLRSALCGNAPLLVETGIAVGTNYRIELTPLDGTQPAPHLQRAFPIHCEAVEPAVGDGSE